MQIEKAIKNWKKILGEDYVIEGEKLRPYVKDVSGLERYIPAVLLPGNTEEVKEIVDVANEFETPLYPISRGKNWGLGSKLPVKDNSTIVDLSRMNKIEEVNVKHSYAVIEPGVTQEQLYSYLKENDLPLIMNVTGSGRDSSIIGNALERGVGYFTSRAEEILGLEVVLGNGNIIRTGFSHLPDAKAKYLFKNGIGPSLDGLFFQSNFGIVTKAGINLLRKTDEYSTFVSKIKREEYLPEFVDRLADSFEIIRSVVHIGNKERSRITISPLIYEELCRRYPTNDIDYLRHKAEELFNEEFPAPWSATGRFFGTKTHVNEAKNKMRKIMKGIGSVMYLDDKFINAAEKLAKIFGYIPYVKKKSIVLASVKPVYNLTKGVPTDDAIKSIYWPLTNPPSEQEEMLDPDNYSPCGIIYYLPITPFDGSEVQKMVSTTKEVMKFYGFEPAITLNTVSDKALETVISIPFDRRSLEETRRAHEAVRELHRNLTSKGIYPYRVPISLIDEIIDSNDIFWQTVRDLKKILDPKNIISPGRYNLI
jgi:4-cresol dehydrogenase (hydroxylating)